MKKLFRKAWWYYYYLCFGIMFFGLYPFFLYLFSRKDGLEKVHRLRQKAGKFFLRFMGIRIQVNQRGQHDTVRQCIYCSNHTSELDIMVMLAVVPGKFLFLGKEELEKLPFFGRFFKTLDIPVYRSDASRSVFSFKRAVRRLEEGWSLVIFPEGGIYDDRPSVKPFKEGAFVLAVRSGIPVMPVSLPDNWKLLASEGKHGWPGLSRVNFHPSINPPGKRKEDLIELKQKVFNIIDRDIKLLTDEDHR